MIFQWEMLGYGWPKIVWTSQRSGLPTGHNIILPVTKYPTAVDREYLLGPAIFVRALHWSELHQVYPFKARFFQIPDLVSSFHQLSGFQNRLFPRALRRKVVPLSCFPRAYWVKSIYSCSTDPNEAK